MSGHIVWPAYFAGIATIIGMALGDFATGSSSGTAAGAVIGIGVFAVGYLYYCKRNPEPAPESEDMQSDL